MADNTTIDVIRSHDDRRASLASERPETGTEEISVPVDPDEKYKRDVPPDGGYGWVCVVCVFWINAHTWGINSVSAKPYAPNRANFPLELWRLPQLLSLP